MLRTSNKEMSEIAYLFERLKIAHPLIEYNDEALKLVLSLKDRIKEPGVINNKAQVEELVFENICQRRLILTKKLLVLDAFNNIFRTSVSPNDFSINSSLDQNDLDKFSFNILGIHFNLKQLFWTLKFSIKLYNDELNASSIINTRKYLDENFDFDNYCIKSELNSVKVKNNSLLTEECTDKESCTCGLNLESKLVQVKRSYSPKPNINDSDKYYYRGGCINLEINKEYQSENVINLSLNSSKDKTTHLMSNSENLEIEGYKERLNKQQHHVKQLEDEKSRLESQKQRAEAILNLLKNFVSLKDFYQNNRAKCAFMLSYVKSVKASENSFNDLNFISEIVSFFLEQYENIVNGEYDDFEAIEFLEDEESLIDATYETKLKYIDEAFAVMESELHFHIQIILDDKSDD